MAQGHRFKSEWPSEALSGAPRPHSGRFGRVRQAVAERPLFAHLRRSSMSRIDVQRTLRIAAADVAIGESTPAQNAFCRLWRGQAAGPKESRD
jgi:hypothetical protein